MGGDRPARALVAAVLAGTGLVASPVLAGAATVTTNPETNRIEYFAGFQEEGVVDINRTGVKDEEAPDSAATGILFQNFGGAVLSPSGECRTPDGGPPDFSAVCPVLPELFMEMGDGDDTIAGHTTDVAWKIEANGGDDTISGGEARDVFYGDEGNDVLRGDDGDDILWGMKGDDDLLDETGDHQMVGGGGDDVLSDGDGDSRLFGDRGTLEPPGKDVIIDEGGSDRVDGGDKNDILRLRDGVVERQINCGLGRDDKAIVDAGEASKAFRNGCEHTIRPRG